MTEINWRAWKRTHDGHGRSRQDEGSASIESADGIVQPVAVPDASWQDIQAYRSGEEEAFTRILRRHEQKIAVQMGRFARNALECEELVQDVFVEAYFSLGRYRPDAPFEHWLRRIATRVGYQFWKRQKRQPRLVALEEWDAVVAPPSSEEDAPDKAETILKYLFAHLDIEDRLVLTLMYFEECGVREIADRMEWTEAMVKMHAHRARQKLRKVAEDRSLAETLSWMR